MSHGIFISYRRDDTSGFAGRLFDRITASFPQVSIFLDVQGIEPGANFADVLSEQVGGCDVLLVLVGRRWLAGTTDGRTRLHDPKDFVRIEIEVALARDIRVIPLLIDGASMPVAEELPDTIRPLVQRQALEISHHRFEADLQILIQTLRRTVKTSALETPAGAPEPKLPLNEGSGRAAARSTGRPSSGPDQTAGPLRLPDKPSIAILPFANMGGDKDQEHLADGLVEDTLTALSQVSSLFVVARNSSFAFKGKNADVRDVGRQLGVRYVMEGSVRRSGDRLRVTAQLIDATDGSHIWAERYDRRVQDLFDIQDELTKEIVTALRIQLTDGEQANILLRSTNNIEAWGYAMRGADHIWRGTAADMAQARVFLQRAVACDPAYAKGAALIALTYYYDNRFNYTASKEESHQKAAEWTAKALELDPDDQFAALMRSLVMTLTDDFKEAVEGMKGVVARSPNDAMAWATYARVLINAGQPAEAEKAVRHSMRLNPFYPINYLAVLADSLVQQGRNDEALMVLNEVVKRQPNYISAHLHLAGLYSRLGEMDQARAAVAQVLRINPQYRVAAAASFYLSSDESRKRAFLDSLRAAGLPD